MEPKSIIMHNYSPDQFRATLLEILENLQLHHAPPTSPVVEELMTVVEVAKYFKKNQSTIINWTKKKYLTRYGIGNAIYYKRKEVEYAIVPL